VRCIITAGPTYEPLDQVRRLTNHSTGTLGTGLANHLAALGHDVLLLRGELATARPPVAAVRVIPFSTVADLSARLLGLATPGPIHLFHAAAVSDFAFGQTFLRDETGALVPLHGGKITTRNGRIFAELTPTPKILATLRDAFPAAVLIGWKYEVDGGRQDVRDRCRTQLRECRSDLAVANGPAYGDGFGLVTATEAVHFDDTAGLFRELARRMGEAR
jgi:phosphopantothenate---cysteine ligase (CTP)